MWTLRVPTAPLPPFHWSEGERRGIAFCPCPWRRGKRTEDRSLEVSESEAAYAPGGEACLGYGAVLQGFLEKLSGPSTPGARVLAPSTASSSARGVSAGQLRATRFGSPAAGVAWMDRGRLCSRPA